VIFFASRENNVAELSYAAEGQVEYLIVRPSVFLRDKVERPRPRSTSPIGSYFARFTPVL
jgi:hypothetical protein